MRVVVVTGPGVVELNWMWLPTFIGMDTRLKQELDAAVSSKIVGRPLTEGTLDQVHTLIVDFLCNKYPVEGLREYLNYLSAVGSD